MEVICFNEFFSGFEGDVRSDFTNIVKYRNAIVYYKQGRFHRCGGPAIAYISRWNGMKKWLVEGFLHREDGPAIIYPDGSEEWYFYGTKHRVGGPAASYIDGADEWFEKGLRHRSNGPAVVYSSGFYNGIREWYYEGKEVSAMEVFEKLTPEQKGKVIWNLDRWK